MPLNPICLRLTADGVVHAPCPFDGLRGRTPNCQHVVPVNNLTGNLEGPGAVGDFPGGDGHRRCELTEVVVLAHENQRELPQCAYVEAFHKHALIGRAIAKERHRHASIAAELCAECSSCRDCEAATNDSICAQNSFGEICDVHRSPHAFADARAFSPNLSHHGFWIAALRKKVTMTAVCAGDPIRVAQVGTNADRNSLLANVEMHGTWQFDGRCVGPQG